MMVKGLDISPWSKGMGPISWASMCFYVTFITTTLETAVWDSLSSYSKLTVWYSSFYCTLVALDLKKILVFYLVFSVPCDGFFIIYDWACFSNFRELFQEASGVRATGCTLLFPKLFQIFREKSSKSRLNHCWTSSCYLYPKTFSRASYHFHMCVMSGFLKMRR